MTNNIAKIRAALEYAKSCELGLHVKCNEALAALAELEKAAAEPVATLVGFDVESGRPVDIAWHTDCAAFNSGDKLYAAPPVPPAKPAVGMFTATEMEHAYRRGRADKQLPLDAADAWLTSATRQLVMERTP